MTATLGKRQRRAEADALAVARRSFDLDGWTVHEMDSVPSTNLFAAGLPAWHAVRAETQTAGRGRFQRTWVSDAGGLWLSAVVPAAWRPAPAATGGAEVSAGVAAGPARSSLVLMAGLAVCEAVVRLGVEKLRMRWPNDLLVEDRKLAGLLLDQFAPDRVVVGIGLNIRNQPEAWDGALLNQTARLADLLPEAPTVEDVAAAVLRQLRRVMFETARDGFAAVLPRVNALWGPPRRVELALDGGRRHGLFIHVDDEGCLLLREECGSVTAFQPHQVHHLEELYLR